jgi:O-glycosyl hydrolase
VQAQVAKMLFAPSGLDLSMYRYNIGAGGTGVTVPDRAPQSFAVGPGDYDWTRDPGGVYFLRQAAAYHVQTLVGFSNSAPAFETSDGKACGGTLPAADESGYASYLATITAGLARQFGVHLSYVSPMNEPDDAFAPCGQEGMAVPVAERSPLIVNLGRDLAGQAPFAKVLATENVTPQGAVAADHAVFSPAALPYLGAIGFHGYDYPTQNQLDGVASSLAYTGKPLWMTETCCSTGSGYKRGYDPTMVGGLWLAQTIWTDLAAGEQSFSWWTALSPMLGCDPLTESLCATTDNTTGWNDGLLYYDPDFAADGNQRLYTTRRYWVYALYSRAIRPGAVHYAIAGDTAGVTVQAFHRLEWHLVAINYGTRASTIAVHMPAKSRPYVIDEADRVTPTSAGDDPAPAPALTGETVELTLAPDSVTQVELH